MGMFNDLHKLDQDGAPEAVAAPRMASSAAAPSNPQKGRKAPRKVALKGADGHVLAAPSATVNTGVSAPPILSQPLGEPIGAPNAPAALIAPVVPTAPSPQGTLATVADSTVMLDLHDMPYRKDTFLFTNAEFEALEDLKLHLRRALDLRVTKNDLARCAIAYLIGDISRYGADSAVIAPLTRRRGR